ncbi:MAG TPA: PH domain-containing protein [Candidatus Woesebacteria bacterium]|nr:PH domain-containing protein [Candidatus Woesebacteria bacterium]HNS94795.1 PH domain-containing protein [Candidatus Woesebacteria bacterium]
MTRLTLRPDKQTLGSFCVLPDTRFGEAELGERTILLLRGHPFTQISWVINSVVILILVLIFDIIWGQSLSIRAYFWVNALAVIAVGAYAWYNFLLWYYTVGFVTNRRVIDIDYYGVGKRRLIQAPIAKVADVTAKTSGYFGQVFDFGVVNVQTEGYIQNITFTNVPNPDRAIAIIEATAAGEISTAPPTP